MQIQRTTAMKKLKETARQMVRLEGRARRKQREIEKLMEINSKRPKMRVIERRMATSTATH